MGNLHVIFQANSELIDVLQKDGVLEDFEFRPSYEGSKSRGNYFTESKGRRFSRLGCFISRNYQAHYGDFSNSSNPVWTDETFGPTSVFGLRVNTADRHLIDGNLKQAFEELERHIPDSRKSLSYVGISYCDHNALIFKEERKDEIETLLKS